MGAFGHVVSLLSFVYALAIAHLLTTVARLIGARARVRFSWFHAYWMAIAMLVLVVDWINFWEMRNIAAWSMINIAIVLAAAFADYLQAALVCPEIPPDGPIDLQAFHVQQSRYYIGAFIVGGVVAMISNAYYASGYNIAVFAAQNMTIVPMIAVALGAAIFRNRWVQIAVPILLTAIWAYDLIQVQGALH